MTSFPSTVTSPTSGFSNPARRLTNVDLPHPDGPTITVSSPAGNSTEMFFKTSSDSQVSP